MLYVVTIEATVMVTVNTKGITSEAGEEYDPEREAEELAMDVLETIELEKDGIKWGDITSTDTRIVEL